MSGDRRGTFQLKVVALVSRHWCGAGTEITNYIALVVMLDHETCLALLLEGLLVLYV
jgi:hypothetical protein